MPDNLLDGLRKSFPSLKIDAMVITHPPHIRLFTGFSGSNALLAVTRTKGLLLTDPRYELQVQREVRNVQVLVVHDGNFLELLKKKAWFKACRSIGFDRDRTSYHTAALLKRIVKPARVKPLSRVCEPLAERKNQSAAKALTKAAAIADRVFQRLLSVISPGMTEREIAAEISYFLRQEGADSDAFEPIVVSGPNSALVHGTPSNRKLRPGDAVLLDFGARYRGYHSDISRTVFMGAVKPKLRAVYDAVLESQETAIASVAPGVRARTVYDLAYGVLKRYGFADYFNHGLGHGLGLEVHEFPRISHDTTDILDEGMVFTIEPGVYIPRIGGVRIEDDILVTAKGNNVLTKSPKSLIVL